MLSGVLLYPSGTNWYMLVQLAFLLLRARTGDTLLAALMVLVLRMKWAGDSGSHLVSLCIKPVLEGVSPYGACGSCGRAMLDIM